ncbi:MAG TPA: hypothetical protein VKT72_11365 [Candidatus Baltobacteraceae bacterium]|nr:hypothetical protein [Candidatus Baltobacteraceae bacterium]
MRDLERALADIAEVRERLGHVQRFRGYSGLAAALSGAFAIIAGLLQAVLVPHVQTVHQGHLYFAMWFACCAASVLVNYGAIAHWYVNDATARERWQTTTVGLSILPALVLGAVLSFAFLHANLYAFLPGVWYGCYGVGLFASRTMVPRAVVPIAAAFMIAGMGLLFVPAAIALQWWVLPAGFGTGQLAIGLIVAKERKA